jgi:hypothetical protein
MGVVGKALGRSTRCHRCQGLGRYPQKFDIRVARNNDPCGGWGVGGGRQAPPNLNLGERAKQDMNGDSALDMHELGMIRDEACSTIQCYHNYPFNGPPIIPPPKCAVSVCVSDNFLSGFSAFWGFPATTPPLFYGCNQHGTPRPVNCASFRPTLRDIGPV